MKIVIAGGHLTPALAVIENLKGNEVIYIGRKYALEGDRALSLEYQEITKLGIKFKSLVAGRLQRRFTIYTIPSLLKLPIGFIQSFIILKKEKPDVVVGFGGYVSLPVIISAAILRIPIIIHEQSLSAGLSNKIASVFVKKICISWETSKRFFPQNKTVLTGNPIRENVIKSSSPKNSSKPLLYITGGSLGSHAINLLVEASLQKLLKNFDVIHQTGDSHKFKDFERLEIMKKNRNFKNYILRKFLTTDEIGNVLNASDLVVARAGMNTITELIYLNKPCFLIPLLQGFEQRQNANFMKKIGLAEIGLQDRLTPTIFYESIMSIMKIKARYRTTRQLLVKNASLKLAEVILNENSKA